MLKELRKMMHEQNENINRSKKIKKNQMLKITTMTEFKNSLYWFNIRLDQAEERVSKFKSFQSIQSINKGENKKTMKKMWRNPKGLVELWLKVLRDLGVE